MDETGLRGTDSLLLDNTVDDLAVFDANTVVQNRVGRDTSGTLVTIGGAHDVDTRGDTHAEDLLAGPEGLGLQDRRSGDLAIPAGHPKQDVLDKVPVEEVVTKGDLSDTAKRVLDDSHDRLVGLGRNDLEPDVSPKSCQ